MKLEGGHKPLAQEKRLLINKRIKRLRLARIDMRDQQAIILFLAEEIDYYRDKIEMLERQLNHRVMYECDRRKCDRCEANNKECGYTTDIRHAKNFELNSDIFVETSPPI